MFSGIKLIIIFSYSDVHYYDSHIDSICADFCAEMGPSSLKKVTLSNIKYLNFTRKWEFDINIIISFLFLSILIYYLRSIYFWFFNQCINESRLVRKWVKYLKKKNWHHVKKMLYVLNLKNVNKKEKKEIKQFSLTKFYCESFRK